MELWRESLPNVQFARILAVSLLRYAWELLQLSVLKDCCDTFSICVKIENTQFGRKARAGDGSTHHLLV